MKYTYMSYAAILYCRIYYFINILSMLNSRVPTSMLSMFVEVMHLQFISGF